MREREVTERGLERGDLEKMITDYAAKMAERLRDPKMLGAVSVVIDTQGTRTMVFGPDCDPGKNILYMIMYLKALDEAKEDVKEIMKELIMHGLADEGAPKEEEKKSD